MYFGKNSSELRAAVESNLEGLKKSELALGGEITEALGSETKPMNRFMHTLFLEEYRLSPGDLDEALVGTIREFPILSSDESAILVDMHLSFLKKSDLFSSWQVILA
jgi:hypothetical protein